MFNRRPSQLKVLTAHIAQLEAKVMDLSAQLSALSPAPSRATSTPQPASQERTAWNGPTSCVPIAPARLRPLKLVSQPLEHLDVRQIANVIVTPSHKVVSYDQAGIPWLDYCGELRNVGWKVLQVFKGRWTEVSYEVEVPAIQTQQLAL